MDTAKCYGGRIYYGVMILFLVARSCCCFIHPSFAGSSPSLFLRHRHELNLVPLSRFRDELTYFDNPKMRVSLDGEGEFKGGNSTYQLCLVEEQDLPDLAQFVVTAFGADAVRLSQDANAFERMMMQPAVELANSYSGIIAYAEVLAGMRSRMRDRLTTTDIEKPQLEGLSTEGKINKAAQSSIILALARRIPGTEWRIDVIGSVELRMERNDAKIPFSLPILDKIERGVAKLLKIVRGDKSQFRPYLSNLCVSDEYRGKGIGRDMVRVVENIAKTKWIEEKVYLHVDTDNEAALRLYQSEGYNDAKRRWRTPWTGKASDIGYYVHVIE